ncbi:MAG TPA: molybdopterin-dependent oxidoreductase [Candidatus Nitrosotalea sp.]|nr:molybdopterin-dependent oxidoreductase [Candidatus Nitrosotalea sp.]
MARIWNPGTAAGAVAASVGLAVMYVLSALTGLAALPQALQEPVLALMPGWLFGLLIDRLQHAGKVVEEVGLIIFLILAGALLGAVLHLLEQRWHSGQDTILAAAAAYALIGLVALPLAGSGPFGLALGLQSVVEWALVAALFGFSYELALQRLDLPPRSSDADWGRRRVILGLPGLLALASLATIAIFRAPSWALGLLASSQSSGQTPAETPVGSFYQVSKNFSDPQISARSWGLELNGLVRSPRRYLYSELMAQSLTSEIVTLECVSNLVGGNLISTGSFSGVRLRDLIAAAGPAPAASAVNFNSADGYQESMALTTVQSDPRILVALQLDGAPLPVSHGFPARIVFPGHYGMRGPKWLVQIELAGAEQTGFWEGQGWEHAAVVKTWSRIDVPAAGSIAHAGHVLTLTGVAFAGTRGVAAVEWSPDGGRSWRPAQLQAPLSELSWTLWNATWTPSGEGAHKIVVRARDGSGAWQDARVESSFPSGASGYHSVTVNVAS